MSIIFPVGGCSRTPSDGRTADRGWPPAAGVGFSWLISHRPLRVTAGLAALGVTAWVNLRALQPGLSRLGAESLVALIVAGVAWLAWMAAAPRSPGGLVALAAMGAAGGVVSSISPAGLIFVGVAAAGAGAVRDLTGAAGVAAAGPFAFGCAALVGGSFPGRLAPACAVCLLGLVSGAGRRQLFEQTRQATLITLADERAQVATGTPLSSRASFLTVGVLASRYHYGVDTRAFETADQAAGSAAAMLGRGERLSRLWRYVFAQLLDDYSSVLRHAGTRAAARMWSEVPRGTGDSRVDAAFAAMAEYLARRDGWTVPAWARLPEREAWPWWFVTDLRGLHPRALVESPSSFRRRGVFITSGALERA